jgi:hypothetical protein
VTPPGEAIATMPARDVTLADNQIVAREPFHVIADNIDNADKFVADRHGHRDRFLRPGVPVIYVDVGAADGRFHDADEHVVCADFGNRNFLEPQPRLGFGLHDGFHHFLHDKDYSKPCAKSNVTIGLRESAAYLRLRLIRSLGMMRQHARNS